MGGRLFDPVLARFMNPDPVVQDYEPQNYNRFSYVVNSPYYFNDPSGCFFKKVGNWINKNVIKPVGGSLTKQATGSWVQASPSASGQAMPGIPPRLTSKKSLWMT